MRIALVSQEYPPETAHGGIATQTRQKAIGLKRLGHDVTVVSAAVDHRRSERDDDDVRVVRIPVDADHAMNTETDVWRARSAAVAAELAGIDGDAGLDLVEFPDYGAEGLTWLGARDAAGGPAAVVHLHGPIGMLAGTIGWPEPGSALYREGVEMEGACLRAADAVYASGAPSAEWAARLYGLDERAIPVLHAGVDTGLFRPAAARADRPTVVFAGRVAESKGVGTLVDAALALAERIPALSLEIVGSGDAAFVEGLEARASRSGHPDLLRFAGFVPRERLPETLSRGWVFAAPSRYEGGPGFAYLEAMACGLPVVACAGSGAADAFAGAGVAILVPRDDAGALAAALETLLTDRGARERMGAAAWAHVRATADAEACVGRIEAFYREVLDARPGIVDGSTGSAARGTATR